MIFFLLISVVLSKEFQDNAIQETHNGMNPQGNQPSLGQCRQYLFCSQGEELWDDYMVITNGMERKYCYFRMTKPKGTANCTRNTTVTLTYDTCLLLETTDIKHGTLILEYGKGHKGQFAHSSLIGLCDVGRYEPDASGLARPSPIGVVGGILMLVLYLILWI